MSTPVSLSFAKTAKSKADTAVVFAAEGKLLPEAATLDKKSGGLISSAIETRENFKGRAGDAVSIILPKGSGYKQALVIGLGDPTKLDALAYEQTGGRTMAALKTISAVSTAVLFDAPKGKVAGADAAAAFASGLHLRDYNFDKYKTGKVSPKSRDAKKKEEARKLKDVTIVTPASANAAKTYDEYKAMADGVLFARDLVSEAPNVLYPDSYANILQKDLKKLGVQVEVFDEKKMDQLGFEAHLAVGMGSIRTPRVVVMRWNGLKGGKDAPLAFVGKGVTFDTGGISIKPAAGMEEMKFDMGGSAAVVGLIYALAASKAKVNVVGVVGLAENMPSDRSYRPGDIIGSMAGKTIEVLNTDAEGRLVLCDALTYVQKTYKPKMIVDLATLTGAIMVALGYEYAGAFVNNDKLWSQLEKASKETGEKLWRMPLDESYRNEMKGTATDLQNLGNVGRYGGACSAAGFLEHFIEGDTPWAHIDIAGTAWWKTDKPLTPKGATAFGVRLLYRLVADNYAK